MNGLVITDWTSRAEVCSTASQAWNNLQSQREYRARRDHRQRSSQEQAQKSQRAWKLSGAEYLEYAAEGWSKNRFEIDGGRGF